MYVGYQANREKDRQISEDIWSMIEKLKQVFQLLSIPVFQIEGFEADDVIGTICQKLKNSLPADATHQALQAGKTQKSKAIVITGDRDLMQLVNENVNLYMSFKGISDMTVVDSEKVKERLGILPSQVIDYKALVGDGSDNYPGVPGIGPVGAIKLIQEFGSFEKIYESLSITPQPPLNLRGGLIEKLVNGYESAELSKRLATIKCDVPFTFTIASCLVPSASKITEVLLELGYKSLIRRVAVKSSDEDSSRPRLF
jgi:DNA polymerase-1